MAGGEMISSGHGLTLEESLENDGPVLLGGTLGEIRRSDPEN